MTGPKFQNLLVTGGAGFIGSNFIRYLLDQKDFHGRVINLDALTYAGNPASLGDVEAAHGGGRYRFVQGDICDRSLVEAVFRDFQVDGVAHFAAESHVDRSIHGPEAFIRTNVLGTFTLLDCARVAWAGRQDVRFHHVSTDEVYGSLGPGGYFREDTPYDPRSPYSASKASSDHLARAYHHTYGFPVTVTNCSNNYGPYQFPEKLIPLMILNILEGRPLPVYGDGRNVRDWVFVDDHNSAVWLVMTRGEPGETFNIGGENEWQNLDLVTTLCELMAGALGRDPDEVKKLITFVADRPGHDRRYAIDCSKLKKTLGWNQTMDFREGLAKTVAWYLDNPDWVQGIRTGEYTRWMTEHYPE
ncbi:MAG: dTDP-glucose 4,6-dehydratase [Holophaga sp.]|jgi:dTDP-glucose 4,6-dehydratase